MRQCYGELDLTGGLDSPCIADSNGDDFDCSDVAAVAGWGVSHRIDVLRPVEMSLIGCQGVRGSLVDRRAADEQVVRFGRTAVIGQGTEHGIRPDDVAVGAVGDPVACAAFDQVEIGVRDRSVIEQIRPVAAV